MSAAVPVGDPGPRGREGAHRRQPSVRVRLLLFLLVPAAILLLAGGACVYVVALRYSDHVHDRDLALSTIGLARTLADEHSDGHLARETARLVEFSPGGHIYFSIRSMRHGLLSGTRANLAVPPAGAAGASPVLYDAAIDGVPVRAAAMSIPAPRERGDRLVVAMAETREDRQLRAREILLLTIPVQATLIVAMLALVWQGVRFGLRSLEPPIRRLEKRGRNLAPISGPDIPIEILPLTRTIDGLFERVRALVALQERFVADAAHQIRTPLAGMSLQVDRALASRSERDTRDALAQIARLNKRLARSATQLLALARAQVPDAAAGRLVRLDLSAWLAEALAQRVPESLRAGVDIGYQDGDEAAIIDADPGALQELLDNLIDNALLHAGKHGSITVDLHRDGDSVRLAVDDDGPGVPDDMLPRLGDRFFRAPDAVEGGSGLGLAIVKRIADAHHANLRFCRSAFGGLRVEVRFPRATGMRP